MNDGVNLRAFRTWYIDYYTCGIFGGWVGDLFTRDKERPALLFFYRIMLIA